VVKGAEDIAEGTGAYDPSVSVSERLEGWRQQATEAFWTAYRRWPILEFPLELGRRFLRFNASVLAGHLAFRVFLFLVPLLLVAVAVLGYATASGVDLAEQGENLRVGQALAGSIADAGESAQEGRFRTGVIGVLALLTATSGLVAALRLVVATVWEVPVKEAPQSKVKTMAWLLPGIAMICAGIAVRQWLTRRGLILEWFGVLLAIAVNSATLLGLFWILPRRTTRWTDLLPGALAAAVGFLGLNIASAVYFTDKLHKSSEVYGALGVAVTTLLYLFFVGQIVVVATIVNTIWCDREAILARVRDDTEDADDDVTGYPASGRAL
jgi:membrane protein